MDHEKAFTFNEGLLNRWSTKNPDLKGRRKVYTYIKSMKKIIVGLCEFRTQLSPNMACFFFVVLSRSVGVQPTGIQASVSRNSQIRTRDLIMPTLQNPFSSKPKLCSATTPPSVYPRQNMWVKAGLVFVTWCPIWYPKIVLPWQIMDIPRCVLLWSHHVPVKYLSS